MAAPPLRGTLTTSAAYLYRMTLPLAISALTLAALAAAGNAQPVGSPVAPTVDNPNRLAVSNIPAVRRFYDLALSRRVDCCIIGDSNTRNNHIGHEGAMGQALAARFGAYATGVQPVAGVGWWGDAIGSTSSVVFPPFSTEGAPFSLAITQFSDPGFPTSFAGLTAGDVAPYWFNSGLTIAADAPLGLSGPLRYHATHWIFGPASAGSFNPTCRPAWPGDPMLNYAAAPTVSTAGPTRALRDISFDVPPGPRAPTGLLFCFADWAGQREARGPMLVTNQRVENTSRASGIAYSPLWGVGGQAAYHAAYAFSTTFVPVQEWMRQATRLQTGPPVLLVHIIHGGNDINAHLPSLGPVGGLDSATPEGHADNIRAIINSLRTIWTSSGRDPQNLFFLLGPYHPRPDPDSPIPAYEAQWRTIAAQDPQVFTIAGTMLSTTTQLAQRGYLSGGVDPYHLSPAGFITWAQTAVSAMSRALCPADYNENGALAVSDLFMYLNAWFAGERRADFNLSGGLEVQDIFDYLGGWFNGC